MWEELSLGFELKEYVNEAQIWLLSLNVRELISRAPIAFPLYLVRYLNYLLHASVINLAKDLAFIAVIGRLLVPVEDSFLRFGVFATLKSAYRRVMSSLFSFLLGLPLIRGVVSRQVSSILSKMEDDMIERGPKIPEHHNLPKEGFSPREIQQILSKLNGMKQSNWESGKLSGAVYHGGEQLRKLQTDVYGMYTFANQLHPDCFPAVRRMDAEVVSMVLGLFNGPPGSCGTTTSGGTESLLLTCLAAREYARETRGLTEFEIIAPITVHAGVDKAAHYFNMKLIHAPLDPKSMKVDLKAVKSLIGPNTVLLVGSTPNYPHGIMDDVEGLGEIALENSIPLHVDACLGSFIVPFLEQIYFDNIPKFDFRVPGVTSISCDTHKYGFAPKGSSVIMYRSANLRKYQYFVSTDWTGGLYASPTLAGSRPGALVAGCWASMQYMGRDGYLNSAKSIVLTARKLRLGIEKMSDLFFVYGDPLGSVVAFGSHEMSIYDLNDEMSKRGWHLAALQNPPALHMAATELTKRSADDLLKDLADAGQKVLASGSNVANAEGTKALYGVAGSVRTSGVASKLAEGFVDMLYKA